MDLRVPFIGRQKEWETIRKAIVAYGERKIIYIKAEGGIGKTRLLEEIGNRKDFIEIPALSRNITIAVVNEFTKTLWAKQFMTGIKQQAETACISLISTDANSDLEQMVNDLNNMIARSPDAIIVRLGNTPKIAQAIERAISYGIKVLTVDNAQQINGLVSRITTDEHQAAYKALTQMTKSINHHGKIAVFWVQNTPLQEQRKNFVLSNIKQYPDIQALVIPIEKGENITELGYQKAKKLFTEHPDVKAIWITWEDLPRGVIRALQESEGIRANIYSFDILSPEDIDLMRNSKIPWRATIAIDPAIVGREAFRLALKAISSVTIERHHSIPMQLITQEKLRQEDVTWSSLWETFQPVPTQLLMPEILDFDEPDISRELSFAQKVACLLGKHHFDTFFESLRDFSEFEQLGATPEKLVERREKISRNFTYGLQKATLQQRVILRLDTVEKNPRVLNYLLKATFPIDETHRDTVDNIVLLIAGRPEPKETDELIQSKLKDQVHIIPLKPLDEQESFQYLEEKQKLLHTKISQELFRKLLLLSGGKPIFIDLAIEWLARGRLIPWLYEKSLEDIKKLSKKESKGFEPQLVYHIANLRTPLDQLILILSEFRFLDFAKIGELLAISEQEIKSLKVEVKNRVFFKVLPNGQLMLHDEMQRLVEEYVWPIVDPDQEWRREISLKVIEYSSTRIRELDTQEKLDERTSEEILILNEQILRHLLRINLPAALQQFFEMFTEATNDYRYTLRLKWIEWIEEQQDKLQPSEHYEVLIRKAKALLDDACYPEVIEVLDKAESLSPPPEQLVDLLIQKANVFIRQGDLQGGIDIFNKASEISSKNGLRPWIVKAENGLGWAYRLTAQYNKALEHYKKALNIAEEDNLNHEKMLIYNNIGFLTAYKKDIAGYKEQAINQCQESLHLAQKLEDLRGIGRAYTALGSVTFMTGQIGRSLQYFQKALDIFEPANDKEWLSQVYAWRGAAYMSKPHQDFNLAKKNLLRAKELGTLKDQPMILSRLSLIYLLEGELEEAKKSADSCRDIAKKLPDIWYQWVSIRDIARVARYRKEYYRYDELKEMMDNHIEQWHKGTLDKPDTRAWGMLLLELGSLALGRNDISTAVKHYNDGMEILTTLGQYGGDTTEVYLERLMQEVFKDNLALTSKQIQEIGGQLLKSWQKKEDLRIQYPNVRRIYINWSQWED